MHTHGCRRRFWGVRKTPSPAHGLGGRMDPRGSEDFRVNTGIPVHTWERSQLLPAQQQPVGSSVPVVPLPRPALPQ